RPAVSAMAEVMGQRGLMGFGVVLAWLVLFHLLVNIWLLCVFTSLLLVLGGWFGSQAILESNNVVHLERFIKLEQVIAPLMEQLDQEIHHTVRKIIRDFVSSWYSTVSTESAFETEVQEAMISMAMELKLRARGVDRKDLTQKVLNLVGAHLQDYLRAKELVKDQQQRSERKQLWKAYSSIVTPHVAMGDEAAEVNYIRAMVDCLLHVLVPSPHLETQTGRFVVGELITCNVLLPLVAKLSDPDWLNLLVIEILGRSNAQTERVAPQPEICAPPLPAADSETDAPQQAVSLPPVVSEAPSQRAEAGLSEDRETAASEFTAYDVSDSDEVRFSQTFSEEDDASRPFLRCYMRGRKSNPFYQETDSDPDSPLADYKPSSTDSLLLIGQEDGLYDRARDCTTATENNNGIDLEDVSLSPVDASHPKVLVNSSGAVNACELMVANPLQGSSPMSTFSFEPLSSPEGPVIIQNLRITGTITAKEHRGTGSHPYTLYTIKLVESLLPSSEHPAPLQPVAYHMVNRRYSEFLNLQTRLEEKAELRKLIKGVKGPKKIFPDMPFGNMDSDKIEARKGLLETFLKQLCAISEIANSEEMQEFLALNTDARIAFVKKPFIVSRIDKIVVNAIVDTLKTAFPRSEPQSPTEDNESEVDGGKLGVDKKSRWDSSLFGGQSINHNVFNGMSLVDLQAFVSEEEKLSLKEAEREESPESGQRGDSSSEMSLAEVALNILCLLLKEHWSWLCSENIQRTVRLLFGTLINRWLDVSVANLTCTKYWVAYLQVVQEAVWPGGALPAAAPPERSQQQKDQTKQQALDCLTNLVCSLTWRHPGHSIFLCFCRHLVFCMFDVLLDFLLPELPEEDFQRSLLQTLSKNPEKMLA
uniref:Sorting nexin 19b n=1 Tax=Cyprinodon variegatus TaxID=28743 RepID=A0A3Q2CCX1_CYPVA